MQAASRFNPYLLYLVANRPSYYDHDVFLAKVAAAVRGGVTCVQLRDHSGDYPETLEVATRLMAMLQGRVPLFINTYRSIEVARWAGAHGVYLEDDSDYVDVRRALGKGAVVGLSSTSMWAGDYISVKVGPSNRTCPRNDDVVGVDRLKWLRANREQPLVAIGGITLENVQSIYRKLDPEKDGIAMAGGIMDTPDPFATAQKIREVYAKVDSVYR